MAATGKTVREKLAEQALFGFDTTGWQQTVSGRRTISRRGGKVPPMEGALLDEGAILSELNQVETAAADVDQPAGDDRAET